MFKLRLFRWFPEYLLSALFLFFALRELGTFPSAWTDDGLFMIVARMIAEGRGYVLPTLSSDWANPYILGVGPPLILPVALAVKLFGFSVAVARIPMIIYMAAGVVFSYLFVERTSGRNAARWTAALLITLSAFINTGKPMMGEIPAFAFVMAALLLHSQWRSKWMPGTAGALLGLAVATKVTFGLVLPALGCVWLVALIRRKWDAVRTSTVCIVSALIVIAIMSYFLGALDAGYYREIQIFALGGGDPIFATIRENPLALFRAAYGHFALILLLGMVGLWKKGGDVSRSERIFITALIILFSLYFLSGPLWYRCLLPATLLLFLTAPVGAAHMLGKRSAIVLLSAMMLFQGWWQFDHRGSTKSTEAEEAAVVLEAQYQDRDIVLIPPEVYVRLEQNPRWLFLSTELETEERRPAFLADEWEEKKCVARVRKLNAKQQDELHERITELAGRYFIIDPPLSCN